MRYKPLIIILFISIILTDSILAGPEEDYLKAVEFYKNQKYEEAEDIFLNILEEEPEPQLYYRTKFYITKCKIKNGEPKEAAVRLLDYIKDKKFIEYISAEKLMETLAEIEFEDKVKEIEKIIKNSKFNEIRIEAVKTLREYYDKNKENLSSFLLDILQAEPDMEVAKAVSETINKTGYIDKEKVMDIYKKGNEFVKKKLLFLISKMDNEDLLIELQEENRKRSGSLKEYISWALAKMDPYRFAEAYEGKLKKEEEKVVIDTGDAEITVESIFENSKKIDILENKIGEKGIVYGVRRSSISIIFTDFYLTE